ncbi:MAG: hypothetical protein IRZ26_03770 [Clostridia bacterium]|nr:hypothetical protein [Clostridia bacterium]
MRAEVLREQVEGWLPEARARVRARFQWSEPDFDWTSRSLEALWRRRQEFEPEVAEALDFLYRYELPFRRKEEELVAAGIDPLRDYARFREELDRFEAAFWQSQAAEAEEAAEPRVAGAAQETAEAAERLLSSWWRQRRGEPPRPRHRRFLSEASDEQVAFQLSRLALENGCRLRNRRRGRLPWRVEGADPELELELFDVEAQRDLSALAKLDPGFDPTRALQVAWHRPSAAEVELFVTDPTSQGTWPDELDPAILRQLSWLDVVSEILADGLRWIER